MIHAGDAFCQKASPAPPFKSFYEKGKGNSRVICKTTREQYGYPYFFL